MSFRGRLTLFFGTLVVVPMIAIGFVLFSLVDSSEEGKADARLATSLDVAFSAYGDGRAAARPALQRAGADPGLNRALARGDRSAVAGRLRGLVRTDPRVVSAVLRPTGGRPVDAGSPVGVAPATAVLRARAGRRLGRLALSVTDARRLAAGVRRRTGVALVVLRAGRPVAASRGAPRGGAVRSGNFTAAGTHYRGRRQRVSGPGGAPVELVALVHRRAAEGRVADSRWLIAGIVAVFLALALAGSLFVVRSLQAQVAQLLAAARRLAGGDFSRPVPTDGDDEFAQLGREFNRMSEELRTQVEEVERRRRQMEQAIRRVGTAFASGLDAQAVVQLTVQTAVDACGADAGFALPLVDHVFEEVAVGPAEPGHEAARRAAERQALRAGPDTGRELLDVPVGGVMQQRSAAAIERDGFHALAQPLRARRGGRTSAQFIGVVSIAQRGRPFTDAEAELLEYLASQAVVSLENAALHETVSKQALRDELTGLANVREMHGALDREFERGKRFATPVGLILLDLDDFKLVNDTYGHLQGDRVLAAVGRVLQGLSRDIDEPARYGGEELAVVLPQTDVQGAALLAERMRRAIEVLPVPLRGNEGASLHVTASFGVASVPSGGSDKQTLLAAADAALYRAKRAGRNRVERGDLRGPPTGAPAGGDPPGVRRRSGSGRWD